ncbi:hypothetical protein B0T20DRAFT_493851 [Sordaria brevicollis]|uniref:RecQ mediated genome instability protein 1-like N-terminal helical domain-containing protein n=1 Tax=Sordaria brevicollis TaxID=83679 RepID=A0AAE0NRC1_SORBR|nr:hypothetical protein B0T20DRAFT_493851 [Sordaria brevicollis]
METARTLHRQITTTSSSTWGHLPIPSLTWLSSIIPSNTVRTPPLPSLLATARSRLLSSDLSTPGLLDPTWVSSHTFPSSIITNGTQQQQQPPNSTNARSGSASGPVSGTAKEVVVLDREIIVQLLDIQNISLSKWEIVEELESVERGEQTRGRQVIRLPTTTSDSNNDDGSDLDLGDGGSQTQLAQNTTQGQAAAAQAAQAKERRNATHKLTLQDAAGQKIYAVELKRVEEVSVPKMVGGKQIGNTPIGCKLVLKKGTKVARGVVLLEPGLVQVLGGRVEAWGKVWDEGRLERLRGEVQGLGQT